MPADVLPDSVRRYDHHRRRLMLSELLGEPGRAFAIAYQLALAEHDADADRPWPSAPRRRTRRPGALLKVSLANYLAAAMMMPYEAFREACERTSHDIELIGAAVRGQLRAGLPPADHALAADLARHAVLHAAGGLGRQHLQALRRRVLSVLRFGGSCPRWRMHEAFRTPGRVITQMVETPDGARYFTLARTVPRDRRALRRRGRGPGHRARLRAEVRAAADLFARPGPRRAAVTEIGPACRVCERPACPQRAAEPLGRTLMVDDFTKSISPYPFAPG